MGVKKDLVKEVELVNIYDESHEIGQSIKVHNDINCCSVATLSCVTDLSFNHCNLYLRRFGRRHRKGMPMTEVIKSLEMFTRYHVEDLGYHHGERITLGRFLKLYPKGRYYCCVREHSFAVIDGVVYDHSLGLRRQIVMAYQIRD